MTDVPGAHLTMTTWLCPFQSIVHTSFMTWPAWRWRWRLWFWFWAQVNSSYSYSYSWPRGTRDTAQLHVTHSFLNQA